MRYLPPSDLPRHLILGLLIGVLVLSKDAVAQQQQQRYPRGSAGELVELCAGRLPTPSTPSVGVLACANFIAGFVDYSSFAAARGGYRPFCLPRGTTPRKMQEAFTGYARATPERLREHRAVVLFDALVASFPCESPVAPRNSDSGDNGDNSAPEGNE